MFCAIKNVRGFGTSVLRQNNLPLTVFLVLCLTAHSAAQNSYLVASAVSLVASQPSSQVASQPNSQTLSTAISQPSESPLPSDNADKIIYDDSCRPAHQDMISRAMKDAAQMTLVTIQNTVDHEKDPAFWELFGPGAVGNITSIRGAFEQVLQTPFVIAARCNFDDTDAACSDPLMYGGIGGKIPSGQPAKWDENQALQGQLTFCRDFFALPTLDHRVQLGINGHDVFLETPYNLGYYHDNQATTLLRSLFRFLPISEGLNRPISDLWVFLRHSGQTRWSACYGIYCAKLLARLNDQSNDWASINADNYALYALSKYVAPKINNSFPFLLEMKNYLNWSAYVVPDDSIPSKPAALRDPYSLPSFSQPNYNITRLQRSSGILDFDSLLDVNRTADISNTPFLVNTDTYPSIYNSQLDFSERAFAPAFSDLAIDIDSTYNLTCFGDNSSLYSNVKEFDGNEALDLAEKFCNDVISHKEEGNNLPPTVRTALWTKNFTRDYPLTNVNTSVHLGFAATSDPALYIQSRSIESLFEGNVADAKFNHCGLLFEGIINRCGSDSTKRKGGFIKLNDRIYGIHTVPENRPRPVPWPADYASLGELKCADYNATSYWRVAFSNETDQATSQTLIPAPIAMTDTDRLSKLCTCWYSEHPFTADMFCKDPAGTCEELATNDMRVAAYWKRFIC